MITQAYINHLGKVIADLRVGLDTDPFGFDYDLVEAVMEEISASHKLLTNHAYTGTQEADQLAPSWCQILTRYDVVVTNIRQVYNRYLDMDSSKLPLLWYWIKERGYGLAESWELMAQGTATLIDSPHDWAEDRLYSLFPEAAEALDGPLASAVEVDWGHMFSLFTDSAGVKRFKFDGDDYYVEVQDA